MDFANFFIYHFPIATGVNYTCYVRSIYVLCSEGYWKPTRRGCLCDNSKLSFFPRLIFNWRTFSTRVTARWWRHKQKIKCRPIRTREIGGVTLSDVLYWNIRNRTANRMQVLNSKYEVQCHLYLETHFLSAEKGKKLSSIYNKKSLGWFNQITAVFTAGRLNPTNT